MKARDQLLALRKAEDPFATPAAQLDELRLEAARELFAERRQQVPLLARLASENGVSEIGQPADLVPVLFSHSSYKSYPAAFMKKGQWDRMFQWLAMVQTQSPVGIPTDGITDMDDWIARLWENGHLVNTTSATSGKTSILPRNAHDQEITRDYMLSVPGWPNPIKPDNSRHFFMFAPRRGTHSSSVMGAMVAELYGRPDSCHYLIDEMRVTDISAAAEFRLRLADGTATPSEIAEMEARAKAKAAQNAERLDEMIDLIISLRHEPMYILGMWAPMWMVYQRAKERGIKGGDFNPETIISVGGGTKGQVYPDDYQEQILSFLGPVRTMQAYGMSEMSWYPPRCPANRFHEVPWIISLLLDSTGENLIERREGVVEGRYACLDLSYDARWGGLISGDKVEIDYSSTCACGHPGPTILPTIMRYSDIGDDRIGCSGTIDSYVRGALAA